MQVGTEASNEGVDMIPSKISPSNLFTGDLYSYQSHMWPTKIGGCVLRRWFLSPSWVLMSMPPRMSVILSVGPSIQQALNVYQLIMTVLSGYAL